MFLLSLSKDLCWQSLLCKTSTYSCIGSLWIYSYSSEGRAQRRRSDWVIQQHVFFGPLHHDWKPPWTKTTKEFLYNTFVSATHPRPPTSAEYQAFSTGAADPQPETTQDEWLSAIILSSFGWCITWRFKKHFDKSGNFKSTLIYVITLRFKRHFDNWQLWKHFDVYVSLWYFKSTLTPGNSKDPKDTLCWLYGQYPSASTATSLMLSGKNFYKFFLNLASFCS